MAAITMERTHTAFPLKTVLIIFLIISTVVYGVHAVEKHKDEGVIARNCIAKNPTLSIMTNKETGRTAKICQIDDGRFAVEISRNGREITTFIKNKMRRLEQVVQYLRNGGYE